MAKKEEFKQFDYQNDYIKKNYDRHNLTMPKGKKERVKQAATAAGQSVNEFINEAIDEKLFSQNMNPPQDPEE